MSYSPEQIQDLWARYEAALRCYERARGADSLDESGVVSDELADESEEVAAATPAWERDAFGRYLEAVVIVSSATAD